MKRRPYISLKTKLASALCQMLHDDGAGKLVPVIDHESAKKMTADQVLSLFNFHHHPIAKAFGGPDAHWNLTPLPIVPHRVETATKTVPMVAKAERISAAHQAFRARLLAKVGQSIDIPQPRSRWPKGRKIPSRPFPTRAALRSRSQINR